MFPSSFCAQLAGQYELILLSSIIDNYSELLNTWEKAGEVARDVRLEYKEWQHK